MEYWKILRQKLGNQQLILPAAAGAIVRGNHILMVKAVEDEMWHLPGGLQDLNESITHTVEREIKEELGINLTADVLVSVFTGPEWTVTFKNGDFMQSFLLFFRMQGEFSIEDIVIQKEEISEFAFFPLDSIPANTKECCKVKCDDLIRFSGAVFLH